jgi:hypothetical protein
MTIEEALLRELVESDAHLRVVVAGDGQDAQFKDLLRPVPTTGAP